MMRYIFLGAVIVRFLAFTAMAAITWLWFTVPDRILYREASPAATASQSAEVRQHGRAYYVTPAQKVTLDRLDFAMPWVWFGGASLSVISVLVAAAARLRMTERDAVRVAIGRL